MGLLKISSGSFMFKKKKMVIQPNGKGTETKAYTEYYSALLSSV